MCMSGGRDVDEWLARCGGVVREMLRSGLRDVEELWNSDTDS